MDRNRIKTYAPAARRDFIKVVTERANLLGLFVDRVEPLRTQGDVAIVAGRSYPKDFAEKRNRLANLIKKEGFGQVVEKIAYTWFNRFLALRYMEIHSYLDHGYRVLSNRNGRPAPEILENVDKIQFSGL